MKPPAMARNTTEFFVFPHPHLRSEFEQYRWLPEAMCFGFVGCFFGGVFFVFFFFFKSWEVKCLLTVRMEQNLRGLVGNATVSLHF